MVYNQQWLNWTDAKPPDLQAVINSLAESYTFDHGAIFTKRLVVEFILDLVGYKSSENLSQMTLLEPSCGKGAFLSVVIERLLDSYYQRYGTYQHVASHLQNAIRAIELHKETFTIARTNILTQLIRRGIQSLNALSLLDTWLIQDDFLLTDFSLNFTHIVGNPPYIRQELLPDTLLFYYKKRYQTIYDRADLYIPFIECSLSLLASDGQLAFICPDRWMKNRYGGPLRELISRHYHLQHYIDMTQANAFQENVIAYPAIVVITSQQGTGTTVIHQPPSAVEELREATYQSQSNIQIIPHVAKSSQPWIFNSSPDEHTLLKRLEQDFPLIEDTGCKIGIGVATGNDQVFIKKQEEFFIEEDRLLPLLMTADIQSGHIKWLGKCIINPFTPTGELINLEKYPKLRAYFSAQEYLLRKRHVAQKNPHAWYRTIDKIHETLTYQPKLLIPDIKDKPHVVYDPGHYYPHHNLYVVTSTTWDIQALQTVLQSSITKLFITAYSVKMRGGYLRFQAQNLRRLRLPQWDNVPTSIQERLHNATYMQEHEEINKAVFELYGLSQSEQQLLTNIESSNRVKKMGNSTGKSYCSSSSTLKV